MIKLGMLDFDTSHAIEFARRLNHRGVLRFEREGLREGECGKRPGNGTGKIGSFQRNKSPRRGGSGGLVNDFEHRKAVRSRIIESLGIQHGRAPGE